MNISSNLNPVFRDPDKFSLLTLPDVARVYVIRLMDPKEQVRLALSTKKMENYIRISNIRYFDYGEVSLEENDFDIQVNHGRIPSENSQMTFRTKVQFNKKVMKPWFNEDSSVAEQAITVFKRLQATFHCEETGITFNINTPAIIRNVLDALDNLVFVALGKNNTTVETLNTIMEPYKRKREISVFASEMPLDYYHPNAFKFNKVLYEDGRWVRLEHLLTMKNIERVELGKNNFKSEDLNALLKHWTTIEKRMTSYLQILKTEETNIQEETIFEGLIFLKEFDSDIRVLANHQKKFLLFVAWSSDLLAVWTSFPYQFFPPVDKWPIEYRILEILQRKKVLGDQPENQGVQDEIRQLDEKLAKNGVFYVDGIPHVEDVFYAERPVQYDDVE